MTSPGFIAALTQPKPSCLCISGENLEGRIPRGGGELKEGPWPRRRRRPFDMQRFVSAAGSAETKVKLPSRNNWWPFRSVFHKAPPVDPQLSSRSLTPGRANRTVNYWKKKKFKLKNLSNTSHPTALRVIILFYFFFLELPPPPPPHPARHATGGLTGV